VIPSLTNTSIALAQGYAGILAFALFFLPPGYLLAHLTNLNHFRQRSPAEKLLWSLTLSLPLTIQICVTLGRILPYPYILTLFVLMALAALTLHLTQPKRSTPKLTRPTILAITLAAALGLYFVLAATDIEINHRLYISTVFYDWSVRVPMVAAAMRSAVPPINGLSALSGQPASLRYFYFWYVVTADLARLIRIPAPAALAASCAWSAWALLATLVLAVMGLDLIPTAALFLIKRLHPYPEIEWWHQDRTSSFLSSSLYAPHHIAANACLLTGLLVLSLTQRTPEDPQNRPTSQIILASLFAAICFASAAGSAILPTLTIAIVCVVWAIDLLRQRQYPTLAALAASAPVALILAHTFLHELQTTSAATSGGSLFHLAWRNLEFVRFYQAKYHLISHHAILNFTLQQSAVLAINLFDLGFFLFVLIHRIRRDRHRTLTPGERLTWTILLGAAIPYLFLSSSSIASPNDLGVDSGFLLRLTLQLWAVPWLYTLWQQRHQTIPTPSRRLALIAAFTCLALGLAGEAFQITWERLYFPLVASQTLHEQLDVLTTDHLSQRLYNIRTAYRTLDHLPHPAPLAAPIQYNPISPMQPALTLYATHQVAASDIGCGTSYGGDYQTCLQLLPTLLHLYGNTPSGIARAHAGNDRQDHADPTVATAADAQATCQNLHLYALVAESTDSIWAQPTSWVWTMPAAISNPTVRVILCPNP
jgi:hypothetical protein